MSEIKGQLLGIILTLSIFLAVGGVLTGVFSTMTNSVESKVSEVANTSYTLSNGQ